ncbi:aspartyl protease family protein [Oceanicaulis sp. LC35]|uniref:aspartyl protease family protein n=1 Tax=Oceanicaulis sp. LC35 TaxID=3349635 RepID=UPI003F865049
MHAVKRVCLGLALCSALSASAHARPDTLELLRSPSGYYVAPVFIGEDGPYPFVPDTGASHTAIAQSLAEAHGFISTREHLDDVQTLTAEVQAERYTLIKFSLGPHALNSVDTVVTPTPPDLELEIFGLLGSNAFAGRVIELDYPRARLNLQAEPPQYADARIDPRRQVLTGAARARGVEDDIAVMIDTGSPITIVNDRLAARLRQREMIRVLTVGSVSRIPDTVETDQGVVIRQFQLGGLCLGRMTIHTADLDVFRAMGWENRPAMIVGLDLLQNTTLTIDYRSGAAQIEPGPSDWRCPGERRSQLSH